MPVENIGPNQMKARISQGIDVMTEAALFLRNAHGDVYSTRQAAQLEDAARQLRDVEALIVRVGKDQA